MLFNSLTFLVFFAVVFVLFQLLQNWTAQKRLLLIASYLFYAAWNPPYVAILLFSTALDWWLARRIGHSENEAYRKRLLVVSLVANLGLLGFFKYGGFLLQNFQALLATVGVAYQPPGFDIVLPVGISFYTFASLSYTIDVYRRDVRGDCGFLDYALFVSFFPHLVAGPIVRASVLLPQLGIPRRASVDQIGWGLCLVAIGLFCKCVLADAILAPIADQVYLEPSKFGALDIWTGVLAFSGQIYYDFGGYSLCAIGLALCFGFSFPDNFRWPYAAAGFSDFWRRWHITLSTWLRDYLYVPLGGNRDGRWRTYRNLFLTMLIGGLWHGASWMFVLWGALHGSYLAIERFLRNERDATLRASPLIVLGTFIVITLTWIPFRAPSMSTVGDVAIGLFRVGVPRLLDAYLIVLVLATMMATLIWQYRMRDSSLEAEIGRWGSIVQTAAIAGCLTAIFLCSGGDERAFIYFQF